MTVGQDFMYHFRDVYHPIVVFLEGRLGVRLAMRSWCRIDRVRQRMTLGLIAACQAPNSTKNAVLNDPGDFSGLDPL